MHDLYFVWSTNDTAQKMKFSIKDFFSKCDQIRRKLRIWSHLLKKSLMENFVFCVVFHFMGIFVDLRTLRLVIQARVWADY